MLNNQYSPLINVVSNHLDLNHLYPATRPFLTIFGRTDLSISLSGAKFDPEADFDVRFAVARQNPRQIGKKRKFLCEIFADFFFSASKNETFGIV